MKITIYSILVISLLLLTGCGGNGDQNQEQVQTQNPNGLSDFEMEHGIGPVTEPVELGELDTDLVAEGKEIFRNKCSACHKPAERYIGPAPQGVLEERTPAYVMNMILNPDEMTKKHPEARKLLQEYMSPMPFQNVSKEQARAIVEYFRTIEAEETE